MNSQNFLPDSGRTIIERVEQEDVKLVTLNLLVYKASKEIHLHVFYDTSACYSYLVGVIFLIFYPSKVSENLTLL